MHDPLEYLGEYSWREFLALRLKTQCVVTGVHLCGRKVDLFRRTNCLSRLSEIEPAEPVRRFEDPLPGDLLHIDTKKLGRIERMGHRVTGNRRDSVEGAGGEFLFVAIDDHSRVAFTDLYPDERTDSAVQFLHNAVALPISGGGRSPGARRQRKRFPLQGVRPRLCRAGDPASISRVYRPQTNGKAERFVQSALREWAYGIDYQHSAERIDMLDRWIHHYNWHWPHRGINGMTPTNRLRKSRNNLLMLHI